MIFTKKFCLAFAAGLCVVAGAQAQSSSTVSVDATAKVIKPLTLTRTAHLNFGRIVQNSQAGSVVLDTAGTATSTVSGLVYGGTVAGSTPNAAAFLVGGEANYTYSITLPGTVTLNGPTAATLTASSFMVAVGTNPASAGSGAGTLDGTGNGNFTVGATLAVGASPNVGDYTGTFDVTVSYN